MIKTEIEDKQAIRRRARQAQCEIGLYISGVDPVTNPRLFAALLGIRVKWLLYGEKPRTANYQTS